MCNNCFQYYNLFEKFCTYLSFVIKGHKKAGFLKISSGSSKIINKKTLIFNNIIKKNIFIGEIFFKNKYANIVDGFKDFIASVKMLL